MPTVRRSADRGHFDHGWLDTFHTFSFAGYRDRDHMGFRSLRVMNEDRIAPGRGFGEHGHDDMEIVTCVLSGALAHQDSMGNGEVLQPGEFQRMSAGTGIRHSEFNPSADEPVHLYQIWLLPDERGIAPSYEQRAFDPVARKGRLQPVATPDAGDGALTIHADVRVFLCEPDGAAIVHQPAAGRGAWLQVLRGAVAAAGHKLAAGDGVAYAEGERVEFTGTDAEVMLLDLA